jgi:hypothetical protein
VPCSFFRACPYWGADPGFRFAAPWAEFLRRFAAIKAASVFQCGPSTCIWAVESTQGQWLYD